MKSTATQNISQVELILRNRVFNCYYWKDKCFGLTSETIIDKALELKDLNILNFFIIPGQYKLYRRDESLF